MKKQNKPFVVYNKNNGQILKMSSAPEFMIQNMRNQGEEIIADTIADDRYDYVKNDKIAKRPTMKITRQGNTFTNVPFPCQLKINNEYYNVAENNVELEFDQPGVYKISFEKFPYLNWEDTIEN